VATIGVLAGKPLHRLAYDQETGAWHLEFGEVLLSLQSHWKLVSGDRVLLASGDDGQSYGLGEPIDVRTRCMQLLEGLTVLSTETREPTSDLEIVFGKDHRLLTFNDSSGYEGWNITGPIGPTVVGSGAGPVVNWQPG
jgi:hypothetical protein